MSARFAGIKPTHIRASGKLHAGFQNSLNQSIIELFTFGVATGSISAGLGRDDYARFGDFQIEEIVKRRRQADEDPFVAHVLQFRIRHVIAVLNGICPGIDSGLYADFVRGMDGNLEMLSMRLFNNGRKFRNREIFIGRNFDHVDVLKLVLSDCLPCLIYSVDQQEFLLENGVGKRRIQILNIVTSRDEFASRSENPRARNTAGINRIAQFGVSVDARVTEIPNRGDSAL